ncbi:hypothetical protein IAT38_003890 [Cryptococcus sp. DSM 104549]
MAPKPRSRFIPSLTHFRLFKTIGHFHHHDISNTTAWLPLQHCSGPTCGAPITVCGCGFVYLLNVSGIESGDIESPAWRLRDPNCDRCSWDCKRCHQKKGKKEGRRRWKVYQGGSTESCPAHMLSGEPKKKQAEKVDALAKAETVFRHLMANPGVIARIRNDAAYYVYLKWDHARLQSDAAGQPLDLKAWLEEYLETTKEEAKSPPRAKPAAKRATGGSRAPRVASEEAAAQAPPAQGGSAPAPASAPAPIPTPSPSTDPNHALLDYIFAPSLPPNSQPQPIPPAPFPFFDPPSALSPFQYSPPGYPPTHAQEAWSPPPAHFTYEYGTYGNPLPPSEWQYPRASGEGGDPSGSGSGHAPGTFYWPTRYARQRRHAASSQVPYTRPTSQGSSSGFDLFSRVPSSESDFGFGLGLIGADELPWLGTGAGEAAVGDAGSFPAGTALPRSLDGYPFTPYTPYEYTPSASYTPYSYTPYTEPANHTDFPLSGAARNAVPTGQWYDWFYGPSAQGGAGGVGKMGTGAGVGYD